MTKQRKQIQKIVNAAIARARKANDKAVAERRKRKTVRRGH